MQDRVRTLAGALVQPGLMTLGLGTFLAIMGPFGSNTLGWPWVWVYWTSFIALGACVGFTLGHVLPRFLPRAPEWSIYALTAAGVSIPVTFGVAFVNAGFNFRLSAAELALTYFLVLFISSFATAVVYVVDALTGKRRHGAQEPHRAGAALTEKLPLRLRQAEIWSMTAEDHYLRIRTESGEALILMRLSDAVAACDALEGARTHRSWWVARAAVTEVRKGDGRGVLILRDGLEAPVSRTYYPALREAGWF
jgi:DNA-binding LytR/AlgR family response regulator